MDIQILFNNLNYNIISNLNCNIDQIRNYINLSTDNSKYIIFIDIPIELQQYQYRYILHKILTDEYIKNINIFLIEKLMNQIQINIYINIINLYKIKLIIVKN